MKGKKPVKSSEPTTRQKKGSKSSKSRKGNKWGTPMVATGGTTYTYPTGNSEDY